jgi:hypothetical protein
MDSGGVTALQLQDYAALGPDAALICVNGSDAPACA